MSNASFDRATANTRTNMNAPSPWARWLLLATVGAGVFLITLDNTVLYTALPRLVEDLDATSSQMLWIVNAYPVVVAGLLLGTGTLGDKIGHRPMFIIGMSIFGLASIFAAFSPSPELIIAARAVLAVGAGIMMPSTLSLIRLTFTTSERELSLAIGIWASLAVVAAAVGPLIGGLLLEWFWWGSAFLINVPFAVLALIAIPFVAPRSTPDPTKHWDIISSLLAMFTLVAAVLFIKQLAHSPQNWALIAVSLVVSVAAGFLFVRRQPTLSQPLLTMELFRNQSFISGSIGACFSLVGIGGMEFIVSQKTQLVDGYSPLHAGVVVTACAAGSGLTSIFAGARLHQFGPRLLVAGGLAIGAIGTIVVAIGGAFSNNWVIALGLFVMGTGLGGVMSVASMLMISNAPPHRAGMAASVEEVSYEFGSLSAVALLGSLMTFVYTLRYQQPDGAPSDTSTGLQDALLAVEHGQIAPGLADSIITQANAAFLNGFVACCVLLTVILAAGAAITNRKLRTR